MTISGFATHEGTKRYSGRCPTANGHFRDAQTWLVSSIGIGTYLGNADEKTDRGYTEAIISAVQHGINVIDTAANYRFQRSERSIGKALQILNNDLHFGRDEMVLCTKAGYLPFDSVPPTDVRRYVEETFVRAGIATLDDIVGGSHCMTPAYLQNQLDQSLKNMNIDCVDVFYVHNPESQLAFVSEETFYSKLRKAFELLEENIAAGKIRNYGIATWNGFRVPRTSREHHSLSRLVELAIEVAGDSHGFRFIQLPYNLAMSEALTMQNQTIGDQTTSVLEAAAALGVTVVASASILQGQVARGLPKNLREQLGSLPTDAQTAIQFVRSTPGITVALVGMSHAEHVKENAQLNKVSPISQTEFNRILG